MREPEERPTDSRHPPVSMSEVLSVIVLIACLLSAVVIPALH